MPDEELRETITRLNGGPKRASVPAKIVIYFALGLVIVALPSTLAWSILHDQVIQNRISAYQKSNTRALCALRQDVQERAVAGKAFLLLHPRGIPGIPSVSIKANLAEEERTVEALRFVWCPYVPPPPPLSNRSSRGHPSSTR